MKNAARIFVLLLSALVYAEKSADSIDAFGPGQIWPDTGGAHINAHGGGILFYENTFYWFGEHKIHGGKGNQAWVGVNCYSSKDLYNWKNEGVALAVHKDKHSDITEGCILERPKVIYNPRTREFVMWFHLELKGKDYEAARAGVAVSESVTGPYRFLYSLRPNAGVWPENASAKDKLPAKENILARDFQAGQMSRDMTVFVDDDLSAYHICTSEENQTTHISLLTDDYLRHSGKYIRVFPGRYMEAPAVFKRNGLYYFIGSGCTGWKPNTARCAIAKSIWGPWKEAGNPCIGPDAELTFGSQSTFVLPLPGRKDAYIFMADRWNPRNAIDGRYIWLPVEFDGMKPVLKWHDKWDLTYFDR